MTFFEKAAVAAALLLAAPHSFADELDDMLAARLAESPLRYAEAAEAVAEKAAVGDTLCAFALAVVSREPDAPKSVRMSPENRMRTIERTRRTVVSMSRAHGREGLNAAYLIGLEKGGGRALKAAAEADCAHALNEYGAAVLQSAMKSGARSSASVAAQRASFGYFNRAAAQNDANGLYNLGVCYLRGWGCARNAAQAMECLNKAAAQSHPKALNLIGAMYADGRGAGADEPDPAFPRKDPVAATRYFAQSSSLGNAMGKYRYAQAMLSGEGMDKNPRRAELLLGEAAGQRLPEAMDAYAAILSSSNDEESRKKAIEVWMQCVAIHSYPPSMDKLGGALLAGRGAPKDEKKAVKLFTLAADAGNVEAMRHLADCHDIGLGGLKKSHWNANWWRTNANATQGDRNAMIWISTHTME